MKVLHVLDHSLPIHSGYAFRSEEILKAQVAMGITVLARTGPKHLRSLEKPFQATSTEVRRSRYANSILGSIPVINQLETIRVLRRDIRKIDAHDKLDLIHAHSPSLNGIAAILAARDLKVPVVYEMRASWEDAAVDHGTTRANGLRYKLTRASETWALRNASALTTICVGLKDDICARGISEKKVTIIPNAVDTNRFVRSPGSRNELRAKYDADGRFALVFCGSFYSYEGLELLIDAVAGLRAAIPEILVLLAGGGEQASQLASQVRSRHLDDHVRFLGRVSQQEVVELYSLSDACVFPRHRMELTDKVTPLKPLEAMATGAIVIASDVGGHRELISDGVTGFLCKAGDVESLSTTISDLKHSTKLDAVRGAAREFVVAERTWESSVSNYRRVYQSALSSFNL